MSLHTECSQSRLVEAAQYQLLLARIGIDITHCKDSRFAGLKFFSVDWQLTFFQRHAPIGKQAGGQSVPQE